MLTQCLAAGVLAMMALPAAAFAETVKVAQLADKAARRYRMYYDADAGTSDTPLVMKQFDGHLHLADVATVFGDLGKLSKDANGNRVGGPIMYKGLFWGVVLSASGQGVNLVTRSMDGTLSSAFDLDGDRIADIVDIRLGNGRRFSFLTEELGLRVFDLWLKGKNPLCNNDLAQQLGLPELGCHGTADGSSSGGIGAAGNSDSFFGNWDFFGSLCADYSSPLRRPPVMYGGGFPDHPAHEHTSYVPHGGGGEYERTQIYENPGGEHLYTTRTIEYYDSDGSLIAVVTEIVDKNGDGTRSGWVFSPNPTAEEPAEFTGSESFHADLNEEGDYDSSQTTPPLQRPPDSELNPNDHYEDEGNPPPAPPSNPNEGSPSPDDPNGGLAEYCKAREEARRPTGVEAATDSDAGLFQTACTGPADEPGRGCIDIEFAESRDFEGILDVPEAEQGCGAFAAPGEGGMCEPVTVQQRVRGMIADVMSADLTDRRPICPPSVCNPAP